MGNKCSKCGGKLITGRLIAGTWNIEFFPLDEEKKLIKKHLKVLCDTCIECGNVENIRVEKPEILKK